MIEETAGVIDFSNGCKFIWIRGSGDGEIFGSIQKQDGSILIGSGGWWRTKNPAEAAKVAKLVSNPV